MYILLIFLQFSLLCWIFAGNSHIFEPGMFGWYSLDLAGRRQLQHPMNSKHRQTQNHLFNKPKKKTANPNYGYEPYWENGELKLKPKQIITGKNMACGDECHDLFIEYGKVCGRGKNYTHKTFDNYCQLLNQDCSGREILYLHDRAKCEIPGGSTSGMFKKWVQENLPDIQKEYNPNHGFEPYWPGGDWLFRDPTLGPNETTTRVPLVCGEECNYLYTRIGKVCARQVNNMDHVQCLSFFGLFCILGRHDQFQRGFQTFDTYCKFLDAQCRSIFTERWILVHEGECSHDIDSYFKPINDTIQPKNRLSVYFTKLAKTYGNAGLPHPLRQRPDSPIQNLENQTEIDNSQALYNGPASYLNSAGRAILPYTLRQHIHNVVKDMFFGNHDDN